MPMKGANLGASSESDMSATRSGGQRTRKMKWETEVEAAGIV